MIVHFLHRHVWYTVIILEEGNLPQPQCPQCDILVPQKDLNGRNVTTTQCDKGAERKKCLLLAEEMIKSTTRALQDYGRPLETVASFKYSGWIIAAPDNNCPEVVGNLPKARKRWAHLSRILGREGAIPKVSRSLTGGYTFWVGYMGDDTPRRLGPGGVSTQVRAADHGKETKAASGWELEISAAGDGNSGGGIQGDGRVYSKEADNGREINCDTTHYGPI